MNKMSLIISRPGGNRLFFSFSTTAALRRSVNTLRTWTLCSRGDLEKMKMLSK